MYAVYNKGKQCSESSQLTKLKLLGEILFMDDIKIVLTISIDNFIGINQATFSS